MHSAQARRVAIALIATITSMGVLASSPAGASVLPPPVVPIDRTPYEYVQAVLGQSSGGDLFVTIRAGTEHLGKVLHPDDTETVMGGGMDLDANGEMGPDDRLWLGKGSSVWAFAVDGTATQYPVATPGGGVEPEIAEVRSGPDGRIWFLDAANDRIGAMGTDGSVPVSFPLAGAVQGSHLGAGPDGRVWATGTAGQVAAFTTGGARTDFPAVAGQPSELQAFDGSLWTVAGGKLVRIEADGTRADVIAVPGVAVSQQIEGMVVANGRLWVRDNTEVLTTVDAGGRTAITSIPSYADSWQIDPEWWDVPASLRSTGSLIATPEGDLVGSSFTQLWRIDDPVPGPQITVRPKLITANGVNTLHVDVNAEQLDGAPITGPIKVMVWWHFSLGGPGVVLVNSQLPLTLGTVQLGANGFGSTDIVLTPYRLRQIPSDPVSLSCCTVAAELPGPTVSERGPTSRRVAASPGEYHEIEASPATTSAHFIYQTALGRPMDTAGLVYWSKRFHTGTPHSALASSIAGSASWRNLRVTQAYQRWLNRTPDPSGLRYWSEYLRTHTTVQMDLALATTAAARDAGGTTNAQRAAHLSKGLELSSKSDAGFKAKLDGGARWTTLVRDNYLAREATKARMMRLTRSTGYVDSGNIYERTTQLMRAGDERPMLIAALSRF